MRNKTIKDNDNKWRRISYLLALPFRAVQSLSKGALQLICLSLLLINFSIVSFDFAFSIASKIVSTATSMAGVKGRQTVALQSKAAEIETLKSAKASLSDEKLKLELANSQQRNTILNSRQELASLKSQNAKLQKKIVGQVVVYRGQKRRAEKAVSDAAQRISRRVAIASARNAGSAVAEAMPFVGISVIVGATAWELKDSCELMKDLYELDVAFNPENAIDDDGVCGMKPPTAEEVWRAVRESPRDVWDGARSMYSDLPEWSSGATYEWMLNGRNSILELVGLGEGSK
ncbi:hypothetical protein [Roseovarius pelagicus]|uniref:Uncharacterized protein n=1 Tax=Roseovarius pelagicus TaxID=2980108 RepID=A0ABY6DEB0_9RHOB|nr:hypothetical protein [Roseovarius pelagicus]UXX84487.1 hypothetical protein N7U68_07565 [Roseovarius pelagicus]